MEIKYEPEKTPFPLIEKEKGSVTYEHTLAQRLNRDIFFGTSERNYYIDRYHELCLVAFYNRRVPGTYQFVPEYDFYVTKSRMCLDLYWNLGSMTDVDQIVEKYTGLEEANESQYYEDFTILKERIDDAIEWQRTHVSDPGENWHTFNYRPDLAKELNYIVYEIKDKNADGRIQFYKNEQTEQWEKIALAKEHFSELTRFMNDFEEVDRKELHIRTFLPIEEYAANEGDTFYQAFLKAKKEDSKRKKRKLEFR